MSLEESEIGAVSKPSARPSVTFVGGHADAADDAVDKAFERLDIAAGETKPLPPFGSSPISVENERKALIRAAARLDQWMKDRPTTISQDEVIVWRLSVLLITC